MSLTQHIAMIPRTAWPLGVGLLINSTVFFGNIGLSLFGPVPIIREQLGKTALGKKDKVRVWSLFYKKIAAWIVPSFISTTALHLLTAYLTPSPMVRNLSLVSATSSILVVPYTLFFILPTNNILLDLDKKASLTPAEEKDVEYYFEKWDGLHSVRFAPYGLAWASGFAALLGVVGRW